MRTASKPKENPDPNPVDSLIIDLLDPDPEIQNFGFESGSGSLLPVFIKDFKIFMKKTSIF
jgi:hypothetical protein